jgi:hypothetical protein
MGGHEQVYMDSKSAYKIVYGLSSLSFPLLLFLSLFNLFFAVSFTALSFPLLLYLSLSNLFFTAFLNF